MCTSVATASAAGAAGAGRFWGSACIAWLMLPRSPALPCADTGRHAARCHPKLFNVTVQTRRPAGQGRPAGAGARGGRFMTYAGGPIPGLARTDHIGVTVPDLD